MSQKHTPGPWRVEFHADDTGRNLEGRISTCADFGYIQWDNFAKVCATDEEGKANARLIAAAPDLLEALQGAFVALGRAGGNMMPSGMGSEVDAFAKNEIRQAWEACRAAIAKAEGRG